jgi:serine/threonine protein kinase
MAKSITKEEMKKLARQLNIRVLKEIGKGGQKQVYKVKNLASYEIMVLKAILPDTELERVKREIRAVKIINHDNIPKILKTNIDEITSSSQIVWILEEFVDGESLRDALNNGEKFSLKEIVVFLDTMFSILEVTESKNIVHRDIKPENIIIDNQGNFWLIDFGIARHLDLESLTKSNSPFGPCTIGYSASEQFRNRKKEIDIRADLFSVGVVCAEMILGSNPYLKNAKDILEVIKNIENKPLPLFKIEGDTQYLFARFIKTLGDNRISRRPRTVKEAERLFEIVKSTLKF